MNNYRTRLLNEYIQLKDKYDKLHRMLVKYDANTLDIDLSCPVELLREQKAVMGRYLNILEIRAEIENIKLPIVF